MHANERIAKAAWNLNAGVKDQVTTAIMQATVEGKLKIDKTGLQEIMNFLAANIDAGYHKGYKTFEKSVKQALEESDASSDTKKK